MPENGFESVPERVLMPLCDAFRTKTGSPHPQRRPLAGPQSRRSCPAAPYRPGEPEPSASTRSGPRPGGHRTGNPNAPAPPQTPPNAFANDSGRFLSFRSLAPSQNEAWACPAYSGNGGMKVFTYHGAARRYKETKRTQWAPRRVQAGLDGF